MECSGGGKRVIDELTRGRELIDSLRVMLDGGGALEQPVAQGLVDKILDTFNESLWILSSTESDEVSQVPAVSLDARRLEDSGESCRTSKPKDRRGRYKRRRNGETWTKDTPTLLEDGHAWRKYGQKVILNANHPRSYLRCSHKYEQGCQATKQVQKIEDDPPMYRTTYHGHHSCNIINPIFKQLVAASACDAIILDDAASNYKDSSLILSFGNDEYKLKSSSSSSSKLAGLHGQEKSSSSAAAAGRGDASCCTTSSHSMDQVADIMVDSLFDDLPEF